VIKNIKIALIILLTAILFQLAFTSKPQGSLSYYLSAAQNFSIFEQQLCINYNDVSAFEETLNISNQSITKDTLDYVFRNSTCVKDESKQARGVGYAVSNGYLLLLKIAQKVKPDLGGLYLALIISIVTHTLTSLLLINNSENSTHKKLIIILYAINPIILYYTTFPYYYTFLSLAAAVTVWYKGAEKSISNQIIFLSAWTWLVAVRPTLLFITLIFVIVNIRSKRMGMAFALLIAPLFFSNFIGVKNGIPWHSMVVGQSAWSIPWQKVSDELATDEIAKRLGMGKQSEPIVLEIGKAQYLSVAEKIWTDKWRSEPISQIIKPILNTISGFSYGYVNRSEILTWSSIPIGAIILYVLIISKRYWLIGIVLFSQISISPYFPLVPPYNLFAITLLLFEICRILGNHLKK
jgi:hypothetical protein